jgi:hypothetical protein
MTSTTLNAHSLPANGQPTVAASVRELLIAGKHLVLALWSVAFVLTPKQAAAKTAAQEADALREYAITMQRSDPAFADDLFAAADRHEMG